MKFIDFSGFYFLFFRYFSDFKSLKNHKKGFLCSGPMRADMAWRGHVAAPREPTQTYACPRGCLHGATDKSSSVYWAHIYSGPNRQVKGGHTKAQQATQRALALPPYIPEFFALFASCRTNVIFLFTGEVAACGASDQVARINARRSRGLQFTISWFKSCV